MTRGVFGRLRSSSKRSAGAGYATTFEGPPMRPPNKRWGALSATAKSKSSNSNVLTSPSRSDATETTTASNNDPNKTPRNESNQKGHRRNNSFGEGSISTTASISDASTANVNQKDRSSCYHSALRNRRSRPQEILEEEKKEIPSDVEGDEEDDFFQCAEFRNQVAHEAADLDKEGNSYFERGDYDKAFMSYERALKLKRASLKVDRRPSNNDMLTETESQKASILASVATSINNMTYLRQRAGQATADETMAAYLKSLQIKREILGPNHVSVGKTLNNIGSVFYLKKEFIPALKAYENAYDIMSERLGETHLDVGTVLSNIGDVHTAILDKPKALGFYKRALDIRWSQLGRNDPKVVRLMEQTASLETGKQPRRKQADSDSEDEEFVSEDRERRREFQEECHALREELAEDIRFFDLVERTLAIELVQQKTQFMRTLRSMRQTQDDMVMASLPECSQRSLNTGLDDTEDRSDNDFYYDDDDFSISVMSAPPDLEADYHLKSKQEAPEVLAFLHEIGADRSPPTRKKSKRVQQQRPITPCAKGASKRVTTPPTASSDATSLSSSPYTLSPRSFDEETSRYINFNNSFSGNMRQYPLHPRYRSKSIRYLTPEERRLALISVQERVATLKSKREMEKEEAAAVAFAVKQREGGGGETVRQQQQEQPNLLPNRP